LLGSVSRFPSRFRNCIRTWAPKEKRLRGHEVGGVEFAEGSVDPDAEAVDCDPPAVPKAIAAPIAEDGVPAASPLAVVTTTLLVCMSPREREVMIRTAARWSDNEIAADLGIRPSCRRSRRRRALIHSCRHSPARPAARCGSGNEDVR
jgi:hypothetical protein